LCQHANTRGRRAQRRERGTKLFGEQRIRYFYRLTTKEGGRGGADIMDVGEK